MYIEKAISNTIFNYSVTEKPFLEILFFLFRYLHIVYLLKTIAFKTFKFFKLINMIFIALVYKLREF